MIRRPKHRTRLGRHGNWVEGWGSEHGVPHDRAMPSTAADVVYKIINGHASH
jgi:hypothetical protein